VVSSFVLDGTRIWSTSIRRPDPYEELTEENLFLQSVGVHLTAAEILDDNRTSSKPQIRRNEVLAFVKAG